VEFCVCVCVLAGEKIFIIIIRDTEVVEYTKDINI